jgi:hypothetical protein
MALPVFSVELNLAEGVWEDVTRDTRESQVIGISHGRRDWSDNVDPGKATLKFNNGRSNVNPEIRGRYSPRNPRSDLFGIIGRNTRIRVRVGDPNVAAFLGGFSGSSVTTPDSAALSITGDIDVRAEIHPDSWRPGAQSGNIDGMIIASKFDTATASANRTWDLTFTEAGRLRFTSTPDGSTTTFRVSTVSVPENSGRLAVRATLDVDNGAAGNTVRFYTAPSIDGPWTLLGDPVTNSGTTSIHDNDQELGVGSGSNGAAVFTNFSTFRGNFYVLQVRDGIDGTLVANADFTVLDADDFDEPFTDSTGALWTFGSSAFTNDASIRFSGEVSTWPQRWDLSDKNVWVPITADGIQRRLQIQDVPSVSSMFNDLSQREDVVAYYPMEEADTRTKFGSGLIGDTTALSIQGRVIPGQDSSFPASLPLPIFDGGAKVDGALPYYRFADNQRVAFLVSIPSDGIDDLAPLISLGASGTAARWDLTYGTGGSIAVNAWDRDGVQIHTGATVAYGVDGKLVVFSLWLDQTGSDIEIQTSSFTVDAGEVSAVAFGETLTGESYGRFTSITVGNLGFDYRGATFGQVFILRDDVHSIWDAIVSSIDAWAGETAGERIQRVAAAAEVTIEFVGDPGDTESMGRQTTNKFVDILREAAKSDFGILTERLGGVGMRYRTRSSLYNQEPKLILDYEEGVIFDPFDPIDDDQFLRNHITVKRVEGQEFRALEVDGPLSVLSPPDGVGVYEDSATISLRSDEQLVDQAFWRLHLGTLDEMRFPAIRFDLRNERIEAIAETILSLREGDRIQIINTPEWLPDKAIDLIIEGWDENVGIATHEITFNCTPAGVWIVGESFNALNPDTGMELADSTTDYASAPDAASLDIPGDIDIRIDVSLDDWNSGSQQVLLGKYNIDASDRGYGIVITSTGQLRLNWSPDGTTVGSASSTVSVAQQGFSGRIALRSVLDVDKNGDHQVIHYTGRTIEGPWLQLGTSLDFAGTTSINDSADPLLVGRWNFGGSTNPTAGTFHKVEVRDGINGNIVANPDFAAVEPGASSFTDGAGNVWTLHGDAEIVYDVSLEPQAAVRYQPENAMIRVDAGPDEEILEVYSDLPGFTQDSTNMPFDIEVKGEVIRVNTIEDGVLDQFNRVEASGLGVATTGQTWATFGGQNGTVSVDGNSGLLSVVGNTGSTEFLSYSLSDTDSTDSFVEVDFDISELPTGAGASTGLRLVTRFQDVGNLYSLDTLIRTDASVDLRISKQLNNSFMTIRTITGIGGGDITAPIAGTTARMGLRFGAVGELLIGQVWMKDNPSIMGVNTATDTSFASGGVGFRVFNSAASTNATVDFTVENFRVRNLQRMNVTRGINGLQQTLVAGDAIEMFNVTRYAL